MTIDFETIIIGAGAMGSAAAYHLARDNRSVLLLEQFAVGHTRGSSHGNSRIIRLAYDHPTYIELARSAYHLWAELESELHRALITTTGGLVMSAPDHASFKFSILIGRMLADLVERGKTEYPIGMFGLRRFL